MELNRIIAAFLLEGNVQQCQSFGSGHINDTFLVTTNTGKKFILQKINRYVFQQPENVMENIIAVTRFLQKKDPDPSHTLQFLSTKNGQFWYQDADGDYWRMYNYLEGFCLDEAESLDDLYQSAFAFGRFQMLLADFPAETLHETIPRFHHTPDRFRQLRLSAAADSVDRKASAQPELNRILELEELASSLQRQLDAGTLPLRVTHNDTKLNNVLLHPTTRKAICILDLDTVMPGLSLYDFGDAVRFGAATAPEDTQDLAAMTMSLDAFRVYTRGFLESATSLTEEEIKCLPLGPIVLTLETACRFLKDYLDGDLYFKTAYADHNLIRARAQLKLAEDMIEKKTIMAQIVQQELAMLNK